MNKRKQSSGQAGAFEEIEITSEALAAGSSALLLSFGLSEILSQRQAEIAASSVFLAMQEQLRNLDASFDEP